MSSWEPTSYEELRRAVADGRMVEDAYLELKSTITNQRLARSLASLAINGGTLLVGVGDDGALEPIQLDGWTEKVNQIAWSGIEPGLSPRVWTVPHPDNPTTGVVVIVVDASPQAPHMAGDRYPTRAGDTTRYLSDPDVARLMERRQAATRDATEELATYMQRDPVDDGDTAHMFLVAVPRLALSSLLVSPPENGARQSWLRSEVIGPVARDTRVRSQWSPGIGSGEITAYARRADGVAFTWGLNADRSQERNEPDRAAELELTDNGTVRLYTARASDTNTGENTLYPAVCIGLTMEALLVAGRIRDITDYRGPWSLGLAFTKLANKPAYWSGEPGAAFPADDYTQLASATAGELEQPERIGWRLLGRFLRALNADQHPELPNLGLPPVPPSD